MTDMTRWNRSALRGFRYVDANAVTHFEQLLNALEADFGGTWPARVDTSDDALAEYLAERQDPMVEIMRAIARATHIVSEHVDVFANEAFLSTATEVANLTNLVELIGYQPVAASSALGWLAFDVTGSDVFIPKRTQAEYQPQGSPSVIFETSTDLTAYESLNKLSLKDAKNNPDPVKSPITLETDIPVSVGEPIVLSTDEKTFARTVTSLRLDANSRKVVTLNEDPPAGFSVGNTTVSAHPRDRLALQGTRSASVSFEGGKVRLREQPVAFRVNDVITLPGQDRPTFHKITVKDNHSITISQPPSSAATSDVVGATIRIPATRVSENEVKVEGDWTSVSHLGIGVVGQPASETGALMIILHFVSAFRWPGGTYTNYAPHLDKLGSYGVTNGSTENGPSGALQALVTTLRVDATIPEGASYYAFFATDGADSIAIDAPVEFDAASAAITTSSVTHTTARDLIVAVDGTSIASGRVATAVDGGQSAKITVDGWTPAEAFYPATTKVYSHFDKTTRLADWDRNTTLVPKNELAFDAVPEEMGIGAPILIESTGRSWSPEIPTASARIVDIDRDRATVTIAPSLVHEFVVDSTRISANVVRCSHGETHDPIVLGSGAADQRNQEFTLQVNDISLTPDNEYASGARPDVVVEVDGRRWTQRPSLQDSRFDAHHYVTAFDRSGNLVIRFGDGTSGRRLPTGSNNVRIQYRRGSGIAGNLSAGSIDSLVKDPPGVAAVRQPAATSGGGDGDNPDDIRTNAPKSILTLDRAVTAKDYAILAERRAGIWQAATIQSGTTTGRTSVVEVAVVAAGGRPTPTQDLQELALSLEAIGLPSTRVTCRDYRLLPLTLQANVSTVTAGFDLEAVQEATESAIAEAFSIRNRRLGQTVRRSDLTRVVESVMGVRAATCTIHCENADVALIRLDGDGQVRTLIAASDELYALAIDRPDITVIAEVYQL